MYQLPCFPGLYHFFLSLFSENQIDMCSELSPQRMSFFNDLGEADVPIDLNVS